MAARSDESDETFASDSDEVPMDEELDTAVDTEEGVDARVIVIAGLSRGSMIISGGLLSGVSGS